VWILLTKLAPKYYRKLDQLLTETGRYRELSSWRKGFKKAWRKLENTPVTLPLNDAYKPNTEKWICTCPSFILSRFLICKHTIQRMHHVPPIFFLEAERYRTAPFWRHKSLKPLEEADAETTETVVESVIEEQERDDEGEGEDDDEEEEDEGCVETHQEDGHTFEEAMEGDIELILDFAKGLRHQIQFRDQRMLNAFQREGASFLRLAKACIGKEKRMNSTRAATVSTWEKSTSSAMFYRTRPTLADENT
jgi:hypothetical protein